MEVDTRGWETTSIGIATGLKGSFPMVWSIDARSAAFDQQLINGGFQTIVSEWTYR